MIKIGDYVTRKKYNNDILFKVIDIQENMYYLCGVDLRLYADSDINDLVLSSIRKKKITIECIRKINVSDYYYIPGTILHLDTDKDYLNQCEEYYKNQKIRYFGILLDIKKFNNNIENLIKKYNPNIVVITGHDAYYKKKGDINDINAYKNSLNFVNTVSMARKYESSHQKLIIIAGACQSDYEELIKAGANFASSPKRINIHALDPAIIASRMSLSDSNAEINLKDIIENTKYGASGMGGIITKGTMYRGYPR